MEPVRVGSAKPRRGGPPGADGQISGDTLVQPPPVVAAPSGDSLSVWLNPPSPAGAGGESSEQALPLVALVARLIQEIKNAWWRGENARVEDIIERYPDLRHHPDAVVRLIGTEVRLHQQAGHAVTAADLARRFPEWADRLHALDDPTTFTPRAAPSARMPAVGETLGEFKLRGVIDRGARGVVYLGEQRNLADRPVVLKVTPCDGREHLSLARLQHAHIVPLYAVHDVEERGLRVLCMPYMGGTTLARLLGALSEIPVAQRTGRDVMAALDLVQGESPVAVPPQGPARQLLARLSYIKAVCWIGGCLAEALHFAHQRDLLHLDVKPSNVLLAADGTPMLLDFHLTQAPLRAGERAAHRLGGTPSYMPPEQWAAMSEARDGRPISTAVDARADVYALGVLLYEALGGAISAGFCPTLGLRFERPPGVPAGLADIVAKCLAFDADARYGNAALLAEDLRRQLADLPLRGVPNRSLAERWAKWRRRRPHALGRAVTVSAALGGLAAGAVLAAGDAQRRLRTAEALLAESRGLLDGHEYLAAARGLERGVALVAPRRGTSLVAYLPRTRSVRAGLEERLGFARDARLADELHETLDRLRFLHGTDVPVSDDLRSLERRLGAAWAARGRIVRHLRVLSDPERAGRLRTDALDLAILWSNLRVRLAGPKEAAAARREALEALTHAETLFGASPVVERERQTHAEALGLKEEAGRAAARVGTLEPGSAWEYYALGRALLDAGDPGAAARQLARAVELEPSDLWGHFYRGACAYRLRQFEQALHAFDVCVALAPRSPECYYNRARAQSALGRNDDAERDYDHVLALAPRFPGAALNRGALRYRRGDYARAVADFHDALDAGADPVSAHYNLALAELARGGRDAARASLKRVIAIDPSHKDARLLAKRLAAEGRR